MTARHVAGSTSGSKKNNKVCESFPNYDPYVLPNGTLRNKFLIEDYSKLREKERERLEKKVVTPELVHFKTIDLNLLREIHKYIFDEFYDWAGEFRIIALFKAEQYFIPTLSIKYSTPDKIQSELKKAICSLNSVRWAKLSKDEVAEKLAKMTAVIWKIHPFRDGNTRAILGSIKVFCIERGIPMNISVFTNLLTRPTKNGKVVGYSVRDMFVGACLEESPEPEYLIRLFRTAIE